MAGELQRIVLIEELDTCTPDVYLDPAKTLWGIVEVEGKTYKFNLRDYVARADCNDPRVTALKKQVDDLTSSLKSILAGLDENTVIEE